MVCLDWSKPTTPSLLGPSSSLPRPKAVDPNSNGPNDPLFLIQQQSLPHQGQPMVEVEIVAEQFSSTWTTCGL